MLRDKDGNPYTSVIIGALEVLVQNYRTAKYSNGSVIANLQSNSDLDLFTAWSNIDLTGFTPSGSDISYAYKATQGSCTSNDISLLNGDTLYFDFDITLISLNLPRAILMKSGVIVGSQLLTAGVNNLSLSISSDGTYSVGFQSVSTGSEFSVTSVTISSAFNKSWITDVNGAMSWYDNNVAYKGSLGGLYNYPAVTNPLFVYMERDGVPESGWRVTSDADYEAIKTIEGGYTVAGGKMKDLTHWTSPNTGADNSSGFTGMGAGQRSDDNGTFSQRDEKLWLWTTDFNTYSLSYDSAILGNAFGNVFANSGFSVRLVRDYSGSPENPPEDPPEIGPGKVLTIGYEAVEFFDKFNITYSIGDIRDLSQGSSDKSYTIELPLTKKNRHILKHINQVDVKSEPVKGARIYMDELIIIQGKIFVLEYTDTHAKVLINSDDWIERLKSKKMNELDLSSYDFTLTNANVEATWSASNAFYRYPMIDFGALASGDIGLTADWSAVDFIPMIRVIDLITKILYPFTIVSDWIAEQFIKDLYILGREKIADASFVTGKHLEISGDAYGDNTNTSSVAAGVTGIAILTSHIVEFNTVTVDEHPSWNTGTHLYTVPETGTYRFKITLDLINTGNTAPFAEMAGQCTIYLMQSGSASDILRTYSSPIGVIDGFQVILDTSYIYLVEGDTIHLEITCYSRAKNTGLSPANLTVGLAETSKLELIWNNPTRYKGINDTIKLSEYMPEMSQADFLGAIRDTCNLRFWLDKSRQNLYIEPWDDLHSTEIRDISSLVDYASLSENPAEMISNNYSKNIKLKWKDDEGDEAYNEHLRMYDSPLTKGIVLTSQFCKSEEEVKEHEWSAIVEGYNLTLVDYTKQVPRIWDHLIIFSEIDFNRKVNFNTRLVHWDGYVACSQSWVYDSVTKDHYPKISGLSWAYLYSQYWQKIYHKIDKGKLYPIRIKVKPGFLTQFMTVIADGTKEGFRPIYKILIDGVDVYFRLQRVTSDGDSAELELFLES